MVKSASPRLPHGGATDYRTLLHELGHALHFGYMRDDLPFEYRWLGDNSITEGYAMLFDHLMHDAGWLARYSALGRTRVGEYRRAAAFEELQFLRRYAAKLVYELRLYGGDTPWSSLPDAYVDILSSATTFRYRTADAFVDVDPGFYSARYLRAWQLQAALREDAVPFGYVLHPIGRLVGLNVVGMRRRGFSRETIRAVQAAYRLLFEGEADGKFAYRLDHVAAEHSAVPEVVRMVAFLRAAKRPVMMTKPRGSHADAGE